MIVKTRKVHPCGHCKKDIAIGTKCDYQEFRFAKYDDCDKQVGIEYFKEWMCLDCVEMFQADQEEMEKEAVEQGFLSHKHMCAEYDMMCDV